MLRNPLLPFLLTLPMLTAACSGGGGGGGGGSDDDAPGTADFPDYLVEEFDTLSAARWDIELDEGVLAPTAEQGRLRFRWEDADVLSRARLVLRQSGFYEGAALNVPEIEIGVEARILIEYLANGVPRRASIGLRGGGERIIEAAIQDGTGANLERETTRLSDLELPPDAMDERVRMEVDTEGQVIRFFFADELIFSYIEPGLSVPATSRVAIEVEARNVQETAIESFEAALLSDVPERRLTDVRANHTPPSRVQWLFKLRDATGQVLALNPEQADSLVSQVFEDEVDIDQSESCAVVRTFAALPLNVVIVLDHTQSMEAFDGIQEMKDSAKTLLDVISDSHTFSIWEFHDNQEDGFQRLLAPGATREQGKQVIDDYDPDIRGFSLCWDTIEEALEDDFPEGNRGSELRVLVFFSDGVDTSSTADPDDLIDEAQDRGVLLYSLGYGQLTADSRLNLSLLSGETGGLFAEALTPGQVLPEFERLNEELSGFLQLAYVTGQLFDPNIESLVALDYEGRRVQQLIRGHFNGRTLAFDEDNDDEPYDPQLGLLAANGPVVQQEGEQTTLDFSLRASHVPRQVEQMRLSVRLFETIEQQESEIPLGSDVQIEVIPQAFGPFHGWSVTPSGQEFLLEGPEVCFGDFGPLARVRIQGPTIPATFRVVLSVDNSIYGGLSSFASSLDGSGVDDDGNWVMSFTGSL